MGGNLMAVERDNTFTDYSTVEEFLQSISREDTDITFQNMSMMNRIDDILYMDKNYIYDYLDELKSMCKTCTLKDNEYDRYLYKPDLLAYDLYGKMEYDFIILALNDIASDKDFDLKRLKLIPPSEISGILSSIMNANIDTIRQNRQEIGV